MSFKDLEQKHNLVNMVILACGKHPTDADINPLLEERLERFYEDAVIEGMAKQMHSSVDRAVNAMGKESTKPEQAVVPFPSFMRKRIEQAIDLAINPKGMSVHDGKATVYASDLQRMIAVIDLAPPRKEWVGLSVNEGRDFFESKLTRAELITEISEFLEEKNNAV
jgi:hypothetical protein